MVTIKLLSGKILFDEFESTSLSDEWVLNPLDISRYNLTESVGTLKLFHGDPDIKLLLDEEQDSYVIDMCNSYLPKLSGDQGGLCVVKSSNETLELLEYFDEEQVEAFVYKFMRLVRIGNLYCAYGKNVESSDWEFIGTARMSSINGQVGITLKGTNLPGFVEMHCEYFRMYKSQKVQMLNLRPGYSVSMKDENGKLISYKDCRGEDGGVYLDFDMIPPFQVYFEIYDENKVLVHTTDLFDACGGDVYYYGYTLQVFIEDTLLSNTDGYFLGYYENSLINVPLRVVNSSEVDFKNVQIEAVQYKDLNGYQMVTFSLDNKNFVEKLSVGDVLAKSEVTVYTKVTRDEKYVATTVEPFKFYLLLTNS